MKYIFNNLLIVFLIFIFFSLCAEASSSYKIIQDSPGVYVVEVNTHKTKYQLQPVVVSQLETNLSVYERLKPKFVINAGFFDPKNQQTVSYVVMDGYTVLDPKNNENLINNKALEPYMDKILNRTEFRILEDEKGKYIYDIAPHSADIPSNLKLKHAVQAGPMLYPELRLEDDFFILVRDGKIVSESASSLHKYARTAVGIKDNKVYFFIISGEAPMTLEEVSNLTKKWEMEKAMAFDGGGSTSFDSQELHIISEEQGQGRKLKSFIILK